MKPGDDELRKAYQARRTGAADGNAPSPEELQRLVAREGPEAGRLETLDRALSSRGTAGDLELLRAIAEGARTDEPRRWWRSAVPLALAASVLLAVVLSVRGRAPDETRATPADGSPLLVAPGTDAAVAGPILFVWRAVPGARRYRVEVLSDAGTLVTSIETNDTTARYPAVRAAGGDSTYRWVVVALLPEGGEVASRPRRITIKAP